LGFVSVDFAGAAPSPDDDFSDEELSDDEEPESLSLDPAACRPERP
jgi:hypothetical protein